MFYDNDRHDLPRGHNQPLYITADVNRVELKRAMLDLRSSINIISLSMLNAVGISREKIVKQPSRYPVSEAIKPSLLASLTST